MSLSMPIFRVLGPLCLVGGCLLAFAVDLGLLPYADLLRPGLSLAAAGAVLWGLRGFRTGRYRLLHLGLLTAGCGFFALYLYYLRKDYLYFDTSGPFRADLVGYQNDVLLQIGFVIAVFALSTLLGIVSRVRPRSRSGSGEQRRPRRRRTAAVKSSRTIQLLKRGLNRRS